MNDLMTESTVAQRDPVILFHVVADELVVFPREADPSDLIYVMSNPVSRRIWDLLDGKRTLKEIASVLAEEFEGADAATIRPDVERFVAEMIAKKLVRVVAS